MASHVSASTAHASVRRGAASLGAVLLAAICLATLASAGAAAPAPQTSVGLRVARQTAHRVYLIATPSPAVRDPLAAMRLARSAAGVSLPMLYWAGTGGALLSTASPDAETLRGVRRDGTQAWTASGPAAFAAPGNWYIPGAVPHAFVSFAYDLNPTIPMGDTDLQAFDNAGARYVHKVLRHTYAAAVYDGPYRLVYRSFDGARNVISVRQDGRWRRVAITSRHPMSQLVVSPNGRRMVGFLGVGDGSRERVIWLRVQPDGAPRVVGSRVHNAGHFSASFSPDGRRVVLWGDHPQVVRFGQFDGGHKLPYEWCTEAAYLGSRLYLLCQYDVNGETMMRAVIYDAHTWRKLWSVSQPDADTIRCDPTLHHVLLTKFDGSLCRVIDAGTGASASLGAAGEYSDAMLVSGSRAAVVRSADGSVAWVAYVVK